MGAFVISKRFNDEFKFVYTSRRGKEVFTSSGYAVKRDCEDVVEKLKANISEVTFLKTKSAGGKYFFRLVMNEQSFAVSRKYTTELRLQKGIDEVQKYAAASELLDFSQDDFTFWDSDPVDTKQ